VSTALTGGLLAAVLCAALTPLAGRLATRLGIVAGANPDVPTHTRPVPLLGGVAIVAGVAPVLAMAAAADPRWRALVLALVPLVLLGLYKDWAERPLSPILQLVVQGVAAGVLVWGGLRLDVLPHPAADAAASVFLCLWIVNSWNFIDVMDGLAASVAVVCAVTFALAAAHLGDRTAAAVSLAVAGGALGFLLHNRPPARIFMGDVGSFSLGLSFAALVLAMSSDVGSGAGALFLVAVPLADVAFSSLVRIRAGRSPLAGGAEHLCLRLLARGWKGPVIVAAASLAAAAGGTAGLFLLRQAYAPPAATTTTE
jgi:UDP-GlcNAc:undecaprenyl-phosphate GlcNAc-1-phosphate transferase